MKICVGHLILVISTVMLATIIESAPTKFDFRKSKSLSYFDYNQSDEGNEFQNYVDTPEDYPNDVDYEVDALSRTIPTRRRVTTNKPTFNSPIYYIRLPPQPYMFVPGLGYVSQPTQTGAGALLNVPVNFISNGKPGTIYQWSGDFGGFPMPIKPEVAKPKPKPKPKPVDSKIHRLTGKYVFNGKPSDVYVLEDSYNSIYGDTLHNFYP